MNRGPAWISPLVALAVLGLAVTQTLDGLGATGAFGLRVVTMRVEVPLPYQEVDRALERRDRAAAVGKVPNPFSFSRGDPVPSIAPVRPEPGAVATPPPVPVLTAIVWDNDPRALVRWNGREWTIREGGLFDEFQVMRISREQVTLRRGEATLVLHRRNLGE